MPATTNFQDALTKLDTLLPRILRGAELGLNAIAPVVEEALHTAPEHGDQSGAAHASYVVAGAGGDQDTQGELDFATNVAAEFLAEFTGHAGQAGHIDAPTLGPNARGLVIASPVDYAESLAAEGRSPIAPIVQQYTPAMRQAAADGIREALR